MGQLSLLRGKHIWIDGSFRPARLKLDQGRISSIDTSGTWPEALSRGEVDCAGHWVLPGLIDTQVHFREPGLEHREDLVTGSRAAVAGGMTAFLEMPNTNPLTVTEDALADKVRRATRRSFCDFGFFMGATAENAEDMARLERLPGCCGVKIFMGSSTGSLLVADDETLRRVLSHGKRRVAIHAEDEPLLLKLKEELTPQADHPRWHPRLRSPECARLAVSRILKLSAETGRAIHVLHVNSAGEMDLFRKLGPDVLGQRVTVELTPQHLLLEAPECYEQLGNLAQMNPPIREAGHREALWQALDDGIVTCLGSDHAPHTREEKSRPYPASPSGMPGVETLFPLMFDQALRGHITMVRLVEWLAAAPARMYHLEGRGAIAPGMRADFTIADPDSLTRVDQGRHQSRSGWSAFHGRELRGRVASVVLRGRLIWENDDFKGDPIGEPLTYSDC